MNIQTPSVVIGARQILAVLILTGLAMTGPAYAETVTHNQDFSSMLQADAGLTTADWDTTAGQLALFPQGLITIGTLAVSGEAYATAWKDNHILLATGTGNTLLIVDPSTPETPTITKTLTLPAFARHVTVSGDWAYISLGSGLGIQTVNVATVTSPSLGFRATLDGFTNQAVINNNWAYAALSNAGVGVMEVTDPANPVVLPSIDLAGWVRGVDVQGSYLYVAAGNEIVVLSLASAAAPDSVAGRIISGTAYCVTANGNTAFAGGPAGIDILDISVPTAPQLITSLSLGGGSAYDIAVQGDSLFVATGSGGLNIVDVSNLAAPEVVATRISSEYFYDTLLNDGLAWTSNSSNGLVAMQADPQGLDPIRNRAVSVSLNPEGQPVTRANLVADYADSIRFEISTNGGSQWQDIVADGSWVEFDPQGTDMQWRATLIQTEPFPGPVCQNLTLTFDRVHSYADITGVSDIPDDTGGRVRLSWDASRYDAPNQGQLVTEYSVYRRYDTSKLYPPGDWEYLLTVPADQEPNYAATIPTLADSSSLGTNWSVYFVRARTSVPGTFYDSVPDSGYSLNNLAPSPPTGFVVNRDVPEGVQLTWDAPADPDFAHFRLYRTESAQALPSPATLFQVTTATSFFHETPDHWFYQLTMVNLAGLESEPSPHASAVGQLPGREILLVQNSPNPFNPATSIAYVVPAGGGEVQLAIYDFRGRLVSVLVDEFVAAGPHSVMWRGTDRAGRGVASGLYTCRLQCGGKTTTVKMTLVR